VVVLPVAIKVIPDSIDELPNILPLNSLNHWLFTPDSEATTKCKAMVFPLIFSGFMSRLLGHSTYVINPYEDCKATPPQHQLLYLTIS